MAKLKTHKIMVLPDIHVPHQDKKALQLALDAMALYKPDIIVCLGDLLDCYHVSSFDKSPERGENLQEEIDQAREFLAKIDIAHPKARKILLEGNHEHRLQRYINRNAAALGCLRSLKMDILLDVKKYRWKWVPSSQFWTFGPITFTHGEFATLNSAKKHLDTYQTNIVYGHTHRIRHWSQRQLDGSQKESWEAGCLAELDPGYSKHCNWVHGFLTIEVQGDNFWVTPNRISPDYKLSFQGQVLKG